MEARAVTTGTEISWFDSTTLSDSVRADAKTRRSQRRNQPGEQSFARKNKKKRFEISDFKALIHNIS